MAQSTRDLWGGALTRIEGKWGDINLRDCHVDGSNHILLGGVGAEEAGDEGDQGRSQLGHDQGTGDSEQDS